MRKFFLFGTIKHIESLNCSVNGNPKKRIVIEDATGHTYEAQTQTDAACAYSIGWYSVGKSFAFIYHYTKSGKMIIEYIHGENDYLYKAYTAAGWRERYAMENGKRTHIMINNERCVIFKYNNKLDYQDANGSTYNIEQNVWVN